MEKFTRYLSITGSMASILALLITVSAKLNWISFVAYLIAIVGSFFLGSFMLWSAHQLYTLLVIKLSDHWSLKGLYYFIWFSLITLIVLGVFGFLVSASGAILNSFIDEIVNLI